MSNKTLKQEEINRMMNFASKFSDIQIMATLLSQLQWLRFRNLN